MRKSEQKNSSYLSPICCKDSDNNVVIESYQDPQKMVKSGQLNQRRRWIFNKREKYRNKREAIMVDRGEQYDEQDIQPLVDLTNTSDTDKTDLMQR